MANVLHDWAQKWANERPRQYTMTWVIFWNFCSCYCGALIYGWNVWVDPLFTAFYGDVEYTVRRGGPVYALSLSNFMAGFGILLLSIFEVGNKNKTFNIFGWKVQGGQYRKLYIVGLLMQTLFACLLGVAVQYKQLWLLYVASIGYGFFTAFIFPVGIFMAMEAYFAVGQQGIGTGWFNASYGIWAATFSYWGLALSNSLSIQTAIYLTSAISLVVSAIPIPFTNVVVPKWSKYHLHERTEAAEALGEGETPESENKIEPFALPIGVIIRSWQMVVMWFAFLFMMLPGFGFKYLISPMLATVFDASQSTQSTASFLFLFLYSVARFLGGALDKYFDVFIMMRITTIVSVVVHIVQAWLVTQYTSEAATYGFIACQCVSGMVLGVSKVLMFVMCFTVFAPVNFASSSSILMTTFGAASVKGPIFGWWALSDHGLPGDPNFNPTLSSAVSIYCYVSAGIQVLAFSLTFLIRPIDFSEYLEYRTQDGAKSADNESNNPGIRTSSFRQSVESVRMSVVL